jgi:hypothetical protein
MFQPQGARLRLFILKPGRSSYSGPRDFTPISLTSFLLKTMERLVDTFLTDKAGLNATAFQPACLPGWEIQGNGPSSA